MGKLLGTVIEDWRLRPWWMSLMFYFCCYMTFIYMPFDMFIKPVAEDKEIWFGFTLTGWWAKATATLHWLISVSYTHLFRNMKAWMWPWASLYAAQVAIAMFVWSVLNERGGGLLPAVLVGLLFLIPTIALWKSKARFGEVVNASSENLGI